MKSIYQFENYKEFVKAEIATRGRGGYGQMRRLADHLGVHSTLVSQILNGAKHLTPEQTALAAQFLGLSESEADYLVTMVMRQRAGNPALRELLGRKLKELRLRASELSTRIAKQKVLNAEEQAIFYSDWTYSSVRQLLAIPEYRSVERIAVRLGLTEAHVKRVLQFLLRAGLIRSEGDSLRIGPTSTHLESTSPWVKAHHTHWRHKAIQKMSGTEEAELFFSCPVTLSRKDREQVREELLQVIQRICERVDSSPSEELCCLNIDWFEPR